MDSESQTETQEILASRQRFMQNKPTPNHTAISRGSKLATKCCKAKATQLVRVYTRKAKGRTKGQK